MRWVGGQPSYRLGDWVTYQAQFRNGAAQSPFLAIDHSLCNKKGAIKRGCSRPRSTPAPQPPLLILQLPLTPRTLPGLENCVERLSSRVVPSPPILAALPTAVAAAQWLLSNGTS